MDGKGEGRTGSGRMGRMKRRIHAGIELPVLVLLFSMDENKRVDDEKEEITRKNGRRLCILRSNYQEDETAHQKRTRDQAKPAGTAHMKQKVKSTNQSSSLV